MHTRQKLTVHTIRIRMETLVNITCIFTCTMCISFTECIINMNTKKIQDKKAHTSLLEMKPSLSPYTLKQGALRIFIAFSACASCGLH